MKKIILFALLSVDLVSFLSSCSVEKRRYRSGYNIDWVGSKTHSVKNEVIRKNKQVIDEKAVAVETAIQNDDEELTASAANSIALSHVRKGINRVPKKIVEDCDVIVLKSGDEIKAKVVEVTPFEIKYKKCDDQNGVVQTVKKSQVFMIKYPNGTKEVIKQENTSAATSATPQAEDNGIFGILSFLSFVFFILLGVAGVSSGAGVLLLLLLLGSIVFGAIGMGRNRKLKGLAIAGFTLGIALIVLVLIAAAAWSGGWN
jgi:hypothetical protein